MLHQIVRSYDASNNPVINTQLGIQECMQLIAQLHSKLKGKNKSDSSSKRPRIEVRKNAKPSKEPSSTIGQVQNLDSNILPPSLEMLSDSSVFHLQAPQLREGHFIVVKEVFLAHPLFKD